MDNRHFSEDRELLENFVMGRLVDEERLVCEEHVRTCEVCQRAVREERTLIDGVRRVGRDQMRSRLRTRLGERTPVSWQRLVGVAASIIIVAGVGVVFHWWGSFHRDTAVTTTEFRSEPIAPKPEVPEQSQAAANARKADRDELSAADRESGRTAIANETSRGKSSVSPPLSDAVGNISGGATPSRRNENEPARAAEEAKIAKDKKENMQAFAQYPPNERQQQGYWIQGNLIPSSATSGPTVNRLAETLSKNKQLDQGAAAKKTIVEPGRSASEAGIAVNQKLANTAPPPGQQLQGASGAIATEVKAADDRTEMTLYLDSLLNATEISNARFSYVTSDSLILYVGSHVFGYRMPPGWDSTHVLKARLRH